MSQFDALRAEFLRLLTSDSLTQDRRSRDYNQALFMTGEPFDGMPVWDKITLDMVMGKFDRAVQRLSRGDVA